MHHRRRQHHDPRVSMHVVVPFKELSTEASGLFGRVKPLWKIWTANEPATGSTIPETEKIAIYKSVASTAGNDRV